MHSDLPFVVAAPCHPSLDGAIDRFCDGLRVETRWFGRRAATCTKPAPSLIRRLASREPGIRLAAVVHGEIIGLARIDLGSASAPELLVAVAGPWRRQGVALALGRAVVERAQEAGIDRIVLRTSERGVALRELAVELGFEVVDLGHGSVQLIRGREPVGA